MPYDVWLQLSCRNLSYKSGGGAAMSQKTFESVIILIVFSLMLWGNYWAEGQIFPDKPFARLGKGTIE